MELNKKRALAKQRVIEKYGYDDGHRGFNECFRCRKPDSVSMPDPNASVVDKKKIKNWEAFCPSCMEIMSQVGRIEA